MGAGEGAFFVKRTLEGSEGVHQPCEGNHADPEEGVGHPLLNPVARQGVPDPLKDLAIFFGDPGRGSKHELEKQLSHGISSVGWVVGELQTANSPFPTLYTKNTSKSTHFQHKEKMLKSAYTSQKICQKKLQASHFLLLRP